MERVHGCGSYRVKSEREKKQPTPKDAANSTPPGGPSPAASRSLQRPCQEEELVLDVTSYEFFTVLIHVILYMYSQIEAGASPIGPDKRLGRQLQKLRGRPPWKEGG